MGRPRKLTPWFEGHVKPARPGVYEVARRASERKRCPNGLWRYWDGQQWHAAITLQSSAMDVQMLAPFRRSWRGLANPPRVRK